MRQINRAAGVAARAFAHVMEGRHFVHLGAGEVRSLRREARRAARREGRAIVREALAG